MVRIGCHPNSDDSEFWQWAKNEIVLTDFNREYLDYFKNYSVHARCFKNDMKLFGQLNYLQVMHGLDLFNTENIKRMYDSQMQKYNAVINLNTISSDEWENRLQKFTHREALNMVKTRMLQPETIRNINVIKF